MSRFEDLVAIRDPYLSLAGDKSLCVTLPSQKIGDSFSTNIVEGKAYKRSVALHKNNLVPFTDYVCPNASSRFRTQIGHYQAGHYRQHGVSFDFSARGQEGARA